MSGDRDRPRVPGRAIRMLRASLALAGAALVAFALLADRWGYGSTGSLGLGQLLLALFGALAVAVGVLGRRFATLYRDAAVLCVSTLLLLALLELVAIAIGRTWFRAELTGVERLPYYASREWSSTYWHEALLAERMRYAPYVGWKHRPFNGETLQLDENGVRRTPGAECRAGAYRLFAFGGSTLQGWGSPDWGTIPAYLQRGLADRRGPPVCVINLGEDGFVSTQETIALMLRLQSGDAPDASIFYDGVNEIISAAESGRPGVHVTLEPLAARFEQREQPFVTWLRGTRLYALISRLRVGSNPLHHEAVYRHTAVDPTDLGRSAARVYLGNYRLVRSLGDRYGFEVSFFLQPHLVLTRKPLTTEEQAMRDRIGGSFERLARSFYETVRAAEPQLDRLWDISDVFDARTEQLWIDTTGHVTPEGNRLVAEEMFRRMGG